MAEHLCGGRTLCRPMKDKSVFNKAAQCPSVGHASKNFTLVLIKRW